MDTQQSRVFLVEPEERDYINTPLLRDLAAGGLKVPHYSTISALEAAGEQRLHEVEVLISLSCSRAVMDRAHRLKAIINPYTGSERIDREAANERMVIVGNGATPENYVGMAEATVLLLLASFFNLAESERVLRQNLPRPAITAHLLRGKTVGLVGYGRIAQAVAQRLQPWEVRLIVSAPRLHSPLPPGVEHLPLEMVLRQSDAVLVLCSLSDATRNLLNRERLALMKSSAVLVNTARGGIVDEDALAEMLTEGRLRRAAIDAFAIEPLPQDSRLRAAPNAILTPHMIGHNVEAEAAMAHTAAESVRRVLRGRAPVHVFNSEILDQWLARYGQLKSP